MLFILHRFSFVRTSRLIWIKDGLTEETEETEEAEKLGIGSLGFQIGQIVDEKTVCHLLLQVKFMPISVKST